jgi:hypothetical protein
MLTGSSQSPSRSALPIPCARRRTGSQNRRLALHTTSPIRTTDDAVAVAVGNFCRVAASFDQALTRLLSLPLALDRDDFLVAVLR